MAQGATPRRLRVLVLDDDECVRHVVKLVLQRRDCEVVDFADAASCCAFVKSGQDCPCTNGGMCADVLITDVKMPGMSGVEFVEALAECKCRIPHRAAMSAFWTTDLLDRARRHGCRIFVKPLGVPDIDRWLSIVERLVDRSHPLIDRFRG